MMINLKGYNQYFDREKKEQKLRNIEQQQQLLFLLIVSETNLHYQILRFKLFFSLFAGSIASPANVSGYNISSTSIFVQWDHVPAAHQNGAMLYYTVTYRALPSGLRQTVVVAAPAHQTRLTGLNKYTNYSITVFASTCKDGNVSAPIFIVTDEDSK